jgi:hypothetical protein
VYELKVSNRGTAELVQDGKSLWTSDDDGDLSDEIGGDFITEANVGKVLDYLVDIGALTERQADDCWVEIAGEDSDDSGGGEDDDGDPDEPLEGEYIPAAQETNA